MTDLLHQAPTGCDFIVQALTRDLDRLVAIGPDGERMTALGLAEGISRLQQLFESLEPRPLRAAILSRK